MPADNTQAECQVIFLHDDGRSEPHEGLLRLSVKSLEGFEFKYGVIQVASNDRAEETTPMLNRPEHLHIKTERGTFVCYQLGVRSEGNVLLISVFVTGELSSEFEF
ncbi:hypothetical protein N9Y42_11345 [Mariniblastus sp.]|nr:hypothetical protein [Mariniblastus sp.]